MGPRYTRCFDAIREGVAKYNPTIKLAGPEIVLGAQGACEPPTLAPYKRFTGRLAGLIQP